LGVSSFDDSVRQDLRRCVSAEVVATGARGPLERKLPSLLEPGERVTFAGLCTPAGRWWREALDGHIFVTTDRRLVLVSVKFLLAKTIGDEVREREPVSIDYREIRGVKEHLGWLESKLDVDVAGTTIRLTSMRRKGARAAADAIRRHATGRADGVESG
jgi:hypothetical protein